MMAPVFRRRRGPRGYTLLEMLIVVAVLAVVVSFSWPVLRKSMYKSELVSAARRLRDDLARARLEAIESGTARQFRYQPGTGRYEFSARTSTEGGGAALVAAEGLGDDDLLPAGEPLKAEADERLLPGDVCFVGPAVAPSPAGSLALEPQTEWSDPVVFYPSGRALNARIRLVGAGDYYVDVTLRGLTGAAKVGQVQKIEAEQTPGPLPEAPLETSR
jgi:prepilin-type N-terminal cleavage/methylation domain-containing protein